MTDYWLSKAGAKLRDQFDRRWPNRDHASDGWIGDASHAAVVSDHNPCWTCTGDHAGVVRAIDVDVDLDRNDPDAMQRAMNQLIRLARDKKDGGRLSYVIFDHHIASGTYASQFWTWRAYTGDDPHTSHAHVSFTVEGDFHDGRFDLPIFVSAVDRLRTSLAKIRHTLEQRLLPRKRKIQREIDKARADAKRIKHNIADHRE